MKRSDLMEQLGPPVNQASTDLNRYISLAPKNIAYEKSTRTYVRGPESAARFLKSGASRYLAQHRSLVKVVIDIVDAWIEEAPAFDAAPNPARGVNPNPLRSAVSTNYRPQAFGDRFRSRRQDAIRETSLYST